LQNDGFPCHIYIVGEGVSGNQTLVRPGVCSLPFGGGFVLFLVAMNFESFFLAFFVLINNSLA
jgi:hypothetical protein